jgi:hypothetical protein
LLLVCPIPPLLGEGIGEDEEDAVARRFITPAVAGEIMAAELFTAPLVIMEEQAITAV